MPVRARASASSGPTGSMPVRTLVQRVTNQPNEYDQMFRELVSYKIGFYTSCLNQYRAEQNRIEVENDRVSATMAAVSQIERELEIELMNNHQAGWRLASEIIGLERDLRNTTSTSTQEELQIKLEELQKIHAKRDEILDQMKQSDNLNRLPIFTIIKNTLSFLLIVNGEKNSKVRNKIKENIAGDIAKTIFDKIIEELQNERSIKVHRLNDMLIDIIKEKLRTINDGVLIRGERLIEIQLLGSHINIIKQMILSIIQINVVLEKIQNSYSKWFGTKNNSRIKDEISKILVPFNDMLQETSARTSEFIQSIQDNPGAYLPILINKIHNIMKNLSYLPIFLSLSDTLALISSNETVIEYIRSNLETGLRKSRSAITSLSEQLKQQFSGILTNPEYVSQVQRVLGDQYSQYEKDTKCPKDYQEIIKKLNKWESAQGMTYIDAVRYNERANRGNEVTSPLSNYGSPQPNAVGGAKQNRNSRKQRKQRKQRKRTRKSC